MDATQWRVLLEPDGGGTRITQFFRILRLPIWYDRLIWATTPTHRDRGPALHADLERLGVAAARGLRQRGLGADRATPLPVAER